MGVPLLASCNGDVDGSSGGEVAAAARATALQQYVRYIEEERRRDRAGPDAQYISYVAGGIRRLAAALDVAVARDSVLEATVRPRLATLRARADAVERSAASRWPARDARDAFLLAAALLEQAHQARDRPAASDSGDVTAMRRAAESLRPREPLVAQQPEVHAFFDQAARALRDLIAR